MLVLGLPRRWSPACQTWEKDSPERGKGSRCHRGAEEELRVQDSAGRWRETERRSGEVRQVRGGKRVRGPGGRVGPRPSVRLHPLSLP